jgi:PAS domain S-box-containing protein
VTQVFEGSFTRVAYPDDEERLLRSVALQNAHSILQARRRADEDLARTREALRESEERLRAIFTQAAVGISVHSLDGHFLEMNRKFSDILGYSAEQLGHRTLLDIVHGDEVLMTREALRQLLAQSMPDYSVEKRLIRQDGAVIWVFASMTLVRDAAGAPQHLLSVIRDITARKQVETALREETRILELLNQTGRMLASTLETRALIEAVTDAAIELSGAKHGVFLDRALLDAGDALLLHALSGAPREAFEPFRHAHATAICGPTFRGEAPVRSQDLQNDARFDTGGRLGRPAEHPAVRSYLGVPVRVRSGEVIGGLFFGHPDPDVFMERTERLVAGVAAQAGVAIDNASLYEAAKQAAEERKALLESERAARTAAERMSEMKDDFLATLSHELRTPLNAILGWAQVLRSGRVDESDLQKGLETIERNARAQTQLIGDLLDMSRIASGKVRLDIQTIQPVSFIEAAMEAVAPAADAKGIRLEHFLDPDAGPVTGDPHRLQQVMWNLLSNAVKFTPRDGKVQVLLERVNSHIEVSVADTGIGIEPELLPQLFERFRQGDASTTRHHGGLGLGLSIVRSLVELHGGTVGVKSPGRGLGTTVTVHLPLTVVHRGTGAEDRQHPKAHPAALPRFAVVDLAGLHVLVVDDQPDARDLIGRVLEACEARVTTAADAEEGLRLAESARPDVLISDIGMPGTDGFELVRRVRALGADQGGRVPAIALTAFARSEDRTRALRAGFQVHLAKPVDPSELVVTVASVAGRVGEPP